VSTIKASIPDDRATIEWPARTFGEVPTRRGITRRTVRQPNYYSGEPERVTYLYWVDDHGALRGVLENGPADFVVTVDPAYRRRGVGMALIGYAVRRLGVDLNAQRYTRAGAALVNAYLRNGATTSP
jgi:GNAT superfamily N-acetyltransferase